MHSWESIEFHLHDRDTYTIFPSEYAQVLNTCKQYDLIPAYANVVVLNDYGNALVFFSVAPSRVVRRNR